MMVRVAGVALCLAVTVSAAVAQQNESDPQQLKSAQQNQQFQQQQMACEADVYALCGQAIPDQNRIVGCLRANWSKVSKTCRSVMTNYERDHKRRTKPQDK